MLAGSRHVWNATTNAASAYNGSFTAALQPADASVATLPQGDGFLLFNVSLAGAVAWSGQLADGTVIAATSATLWANGRLPLFKLLYSNKGALSQSLSIAATTKIISGSPHWFKKAQAVRAYAAGFGPTTLTAAGAEYVPPGAGHSLLNIVAPGAANIAFSEGGIESVGQFNDLDQVFTVSAAHVATFNMTTAVNPALVKLSKLDVAKGTFTGTMTLKDDNLFTGVLPQLSREVDFSGVLLPGAGMGTGYFLLPSITGPPADVKTSPMTSGLMRIVP